MRPLFALYNVRLSSIYTHDLYKEFYLIIYSIGEPFGKAGAYGAQGTAR